MALKLLVFPLTVLMVVGLFSTLGLGQSPVSPERWAAGRVGYGGGEDESWYDSTDHLVAYANGSAAGEAGIIGHGWSPNNATNQFYWLNKTMAGLDYTYWVRNTQYQIWQGVDGDEISAWYRNFGTNTALGFIAIVSVIMALGAVIGLKIFGFGIGETSTKVILLGSALIGIWSLFSFMAYDLILSIPMFGWIFYMILTLMYLMGIVVQIGGGT